ncbi:MAG: hypothetical protein FJX76_13495 [Armatimonadetes bacterium]|nr:hypothetical protein [Armatimonadota bacterium]
MSDWLDGIAPPGSREIEEALEEFRQEMADELGGAEFVRVKMLPAVPTREEVRVILSAAQAESQRDYLILRVLYASGVRAKEVTDIYVCDVKPDESAIFIRSGKLDKDRYVLVDEETMHLLLEWVRSENKKPDERLFGISDNGTIWAIMRKYGEKTGLVAKYEAMNRSLSPHALRHAFGTHCYENGMDLVSLKALLGHDWLVTTAIYVHTSLRRIQEAYRASHPLTPRDAD